MGEYPKIFRAAPRLWSDIPLQYFVEGLSRPKWGRFYAYARRVRVLEHCDMNEASIEKIDPNSLMHLLSCLPPTHGPLLPNLQKLVWTGQCDDEFFPQALPFISPSLRSLHVVTEGTLFAGAHMCLMIQGLAGRPDINLTDLNFDIWMEDHQSLDHHVVHYDSHGEWPKGPPSQT